MTIGLRCSTRTWVMVLGCLLLQTRCPTSSIADSPIGEEQGQRRVEILGTDDVPVGTAPGWHELFSRGEVTSPIAPGFRLTISGTVRDSDGAAVPDALVVLREDAALTAPYLAETRARQQETFDTPNTVVADDVYAKTRSDVNGRYSFSDVVVGGLTLERSARDLVWNVVAVSKDDQIGWFHLARPKPKSTALSEINHDVRSDRGDITLSRGTPLAGRVLDRDGQPLAQALVSLSSIDRPREEFQLSSKTLENLYSDPSRLTLYYSRLQPRVWTDKNGQFEFLQVPQERIAGVGVYQPDQQFDGVNVWTGPLEPAVEQTYPFGTRASQLTTLPLTITAAEVIYFTAGVANEDGEPIAGAEVVDYPGMRSTGANGEAVFAVTHDRLVSRARGGNANAVIHFQARPPKGSAYLHDSNSISLTELLETRRVEIVLPPGKTVYGTVVDADDGSPVVGAKVGLFLLKPGERTVDWLGNRSGFTTNERGEFTGLLPTNQLDGAHPLYAMVTESDTHAVFISVPSYSASAEERASHATRVSFAPAADSIDVGKLQVSRQNQLWIRVVDENDQPVNAAIVELRGSGLVERQSAGRVLKTFREVELCKAKSADESGLVQCDLVSNDFDTVTIVVDDSSHDPKRFARHELNKSDLQGIAGSSPQRPIVVEVGAGVTITGIVTVDGNPAPGVEVQLSRRIGPSSMLQSSGGFSTRRVVTSTTDASGEYVFNVADEDQFLASVRKAPVEGGNAPSLYSPTRTGPQSYTIRPFAYQSPAAIAAVTTSFVGLVTDQDGNPLPNVRIQFRDYKSGGGRNSMMRVEAATTDADGKFKMDGVRDEPMSLWAIPNRSDYPDLSTQFVDVDPSRPVHIRVDTRLGSKPKKLTPIRILPRQEWRASQ